MSRQEYIILNIMTKKCISLLIVFTCGALISMQAQNIFSKEDKAINSIEALFMCIADMAPCV